MLGAHDPDSPEFFEAEVLFDDGGNGKIEIVWPTIAGRVYALEASADSLVWEQAASVYGVGGEARIHVADIPPPGAPPDPPDPPGHVVKAGTLIRARPTDGPFTRLAWIGAGGVRREVEIAGAFSPDFDDLALAVYTTPPADGVAWQLVVQAIAIPPPDPHDPGLVYPGAANGLDPEDTALLDAFLANLDDLLAAATSGGLGEGQATGSGGGFRHLYRVTESRPDSDNDGVPDDEELARGMDPFRTDSDGDGFGDLAEVEGGSDGADAGSTPAEIAPVPEVGWLTRSHGFDVNEAVPPSQGSHWIRWSDQGELEFVEGDPNAPEVVFATFHDASIAAVQTAGWRSPSPPPLDPLSAWTQSHVTVPDPHALFTGEAEVLEAALATEGGAPAPVAVTRRFIRLETKTSLTPGASPQVVSGSVETVDLAIPAGARNSLHAQAPNGRVLLQAEHEPDRRREVLLLPVEFKTYPDDEPGPDKPHLRNLETRQDEEGFYGERRKCVAHVWQDQWIDLIDYLEGADDPNLRELYEDNLDWRSNGHAVNHELNWVGEPAEDDITVYLIEVLPKGGDDVIDSLYLTVVPRSTKQSFDAWYNAEKADTAWLQELPPVFNRIETTPEPYGYLPRPDRNFNPYFYGVPHEINTRFHPDGYFEQRSYKTPGGHGHQVCFDDGGVLLESGVSAGSADKAAAFPANLNPFLHVEADVKPFMWALHLDGNPTRQDGANLTRPIMREGVFGERYLEVRPALPNGKPRLEPGATP